jgi:hypothetical protein
VLGFFSFTQITDPAAHEAYNAWHQLDHLPEQFTIEGISFGQRWVRSPRCREVESASGELLDPFHYMTLYLLRDRDLLAPFNALARRLYREGRFFAERRALLSGAFEIAGAWAAPRVLVSPGAIPYRPALGVYVVVGPVVDGAGLVEVPGVAGAWQFTDGERSVTVAFVDGDLWQASARLSSQLGGSFASADWAGPLERVDPFRWDWFATLTPQ